MYTEKFKLFVNKAQTENQYIGIGNPNAKILYIGKEAAIIPNNTDAMDSYKENANFWSKLINSNKQDMYEYEVGPDHQFRVEKSWGKNTWSKYQLLTDKILKNETKPNYINFLNHVFTTELNDSPHKHNHLADKSTINERKQFLKDSPFIQDFSVVVLACSDYIVNNDNIREIDTIFGVQYKPISNPKPIVLVTGSLPILMKTKQN